ncbi:hypothetical protein SADUNF_Sadunf01G0105400 [Salix dunnii]|uniref:Uncharacterized protein n=1 Tax=Salix dunnii TaxID=1413687 RepID=A0A835TJX9_9ROSI|nr:hypothetical protein SADUNF_Sadunf01G0105400 [Salix dunnii]
MEAILPIHSSQNWETPGRFRTIEMHGRLIMPLHKNIIVENHLPFSVQVSKLHRISTELVNLTSQQHGSIPQKKRSNDVLFIQNNPTADDISDDSIQHSARVSSFTQARFHSSQPMTRSRSSELRRRYAAMQCARTNTGMEAMQDVSWHGVNNLKHEFGNPNGFIDTANQLGTFISPSTSSSSTFNTPQMSSTDKVSSVVNMLKAQEVIIYSTSDQGKGNGIQEIPPGSFQEISSGQIKNPGVLQALQGPMDLDFEASREPSQSRSSAAAPVASSGFDACDGPSNSRQTLSFCESSRKQVGNGRISENGSRAKGLIYIELFGGVRMAEAKERNMTPAIPTDRQSILKRCENLEKEVRSLKLNLSFMNRKDSEQTKQIEDFQKQNEELLMKKNAS